MKINVFDGPNAEFAHRLFSARQQAGLTQEALANRIGIDKRSISMYENGKMRPRKGTIEQLAEKLGVDSLFLATGHTQETHDYLAKQPRNTSGPLTLAHLFIEPWSTLGRAMLRPAYAEKPLTPNQSDKVDDFVAVPKSVNQLYRATRFPGTVPHNPEFPAGTILVFDYSPVTGENIASGDEVIFQWRGSDQEPGLRRAVREPGMNDVWLVPLDRGHPGEKIAIDLHDIKIIGIVVAKVIWHTPKG